MRPVPLFLKNIAMRIVYEKSAVANTTTITNIGNIKIKDIYQPYIEGFSAFIAMSKGQYLKGTICSYQDTLVFTFSSIFRGSGTAGIFPQDCGGWCGCGD